MEAIGNPEYPYNIYLVGVGGQGILTIGEIISQAVNLQGLPVNFYPTKGMAQRGGFVKAQLRIGKDPVGPAIPERGAHLVLAMERSESLKAVRYLKPEGDFLLWDYIWAPTAVMLGQTSYPELEVVMEQVKTAQGKLIVVSPSFLPDFEGNPAPDNIFLLGIALRRTSLGQVVNFSTVEKALLNRFKRFTSRNLFALKAGYNLEL